MFKLLFGLGAGNVSGSAIGSLSGEYANVYGELGVKSSAIALFLWEIGILGVFLYFIFIRMIFKDAKMLSEEDDLIGILGLGWLAVMPIVFVSLFFKNLFLDNANGYMFWYFSGLVIASKYRRDRVKRLINRT